MGSNGQGDAAANGTEDCRRLEGGNAAVRESKGFAIAVPDPAVSSALDEVAREEGFLLCPETAATYAALKQGLADGRIRRGETAVLFNCATGLARSHKTDRLRIPLEQMSII
jgi:threonine synthase